MHIEGKVEIFIKNIEFFVKIFKAGLQFNEQERHGEEVDDEAKKEGFSGNAF